MKMTVKELKERLEKVADDAEIIFTYNSFNTLKGKEQESLVATSVEESQGKCILR